MKKAVAEMWVRDLRNPDHKQTQGTLTNVDRSAHCCLGRLCELAIKHGVEVSVTEEPVPPAGERTTVAFGGLVQVLPTSVMTWAGLMYHAPMYRDDEKAEFLDRLNDSGATFAQIADVIERNWESIQ